MKSMEDFVRQSLELNLFFLRIMKEHSFFIEAGFLPKDANLAQQGDNYKNIFIDLLAETIELSDCVISPAVKHSGEIVTEFTLAAEKATEFFTNVPLDTTLTKEEINLVPNNGQACHGELAPVVRDLNNRILRAVNSVIDYKTNILDGVLSCKLFTTNYPLLIDHIRREARLYYSMLDRLQRGIQFDIAQEAIEQQRFWNRIMAEHAKFIRGLLDPTEDVLIKTANNFGEEFDALTAKSLALNDSICNITKKDLVATRNIRDFKAQGTEGILNCNIRSIIIPLLGDHTLREANHYLRLLQIFHKEL